MMEHDLKFLNQREELGHNDYALKKKKKGEMQCLS